MLETVIACVVCLLIGAAAIWFYKVRPMQDIIDQTVRPDTPPSNDRLDEALGLITAVHYAAFGPIGVRTLETACNNLWQFAGLAEKGIPKE